MSGYNKSMTQELIRTDVNCPTVFFYLVSIWRKSKNFKRANPLTIQMLAAAMRTCMVLARVINSTFMWLLLKLFCASLVQWDRIKATCAVDMDGFYFLQSNSLYSIVAGHGSRLSWIALGQEEETKSLCMVYVAR